MAGQALYELVAATYSALLSESEDLGDGNHLFEGNVGECLTRNHIKNQHSVALNQLEAMNCIDRIRRGNTYQSSKIAIYKQPTRDEFDKLGPIYGTGRRSKSIDQRFNSLNKRIDYLEKRVDYLMREEHDEVG